MQAEIVICLLVNKYPNFDILSFSKLAMELIILLLLTENSYGIIIIEGIPSILSIRRALS